MDKKREIRIPAAALLIILGVVLVIFKDAAPETVLRILAVGLMAVGAFGVYQQVKDKETKKTTRFGKGFLHVLLVILGVAILIKTVFFAAFVKYVFGGILIFFGHPGVQYLHRRLHRSVKEILRYSIFLPKLSCINLLFPCP